MSWFVAHGCTFHCLPVSQVVDSSVGRGRPEVELLAPDRVGRNAGGLELADRVPDHRRRAADQHRTPGPVARPGGDAADQPTGARVRAVLGDHRGVVEPGLARELGQELVVVEVPGHPGAVEQVHARRRAYGLPLPVDLLQHGPQRGQPGATGDHQEVSVGPFSGSVSCCPTGAREPYGVALAQVADHRRGHDAAGDRLDVEEQVAGGLRGVRRAEVAPQPRPLRDLHRHRLPRRGSRTVPGARSRPRRRPSTAARPASRRPARRRARRPRAARPPRPSPWRSVRRPGPRCRPARRPRSRPGTASRSPSGSRRRAM